MKQALRFGMAAFLCPITRLLQGLQPGLRVLMYHRVARVSQYDQLTVSPERFEQQMLRLKARGRVVSLQEGLRRLQGGDLRENLVAVTFDDGYLDNLREAQPILKKYGIPATIFITTRFCDQVSSHPRYADAAMLDRLHLNWEEVAELANCDIEIGSHTLSHPYLPRLPKERAWQEIAQSREEIELRLARPVRYFCYPSGDLSTREAQMVADAGYDAAVSVAPGLNRFGADVMQLRRTEVTEHDVPGIFECKLDGAFDPLHAVLHARRRRQFSRQHFRGASREITRESRQ